MNLKKSIKNMLGFEDEDDYIYDDYEEDFAVKEAPSVPEFDKYKQRSKNEDSSRRSLYPISGGQSSGSNAKLCIIKPKSFDDSKGICDDMKEGKILIVNTGDMESKEAQRLLDFICGAAYNANGDVQEVEPKVFVLSPPLVEVTRDREAVNKGTFLNF